MDKKDEIILQQLEVIRTMTERNLRSMGDDFWGTPFEGVLSPKSPSAPPSGGKPVGSADGKMPAQPSDGKTAGGQPAAKAEKTEVVEPLPKEDMKDLQAELDSYIGLATVKEEVRNLINMASVYKLRRQHDLPTTDMNASLAFMAAATGAGGSWPSVSRGTMTCRMGSAWTRYTAAAMASAMDRRDASVMISTFSPGFTLTQVDTTLSAPRAISIFFILLPPFQ